MCNFAPFVRFVRSTRPPPAATNVVSIRCLKSPQPHLNYFPKWSQTAPMFRLKGVSLSFLFITLYNLCYGTMTTKVPCILGRVNFSSCPQQRTLRTRSYLEDYACTSSMHYLMKQACIFDGCL